MCMCVCIYIYIYIYIYISLSLGPGGSTCTSPSGAPGRPPGTCFSLSLSLFLYHSNFFSILCRTYLWLCCFAVYVIIILIVFSCLFFVLFFNFFFSFSFFFFKKDLFSVFLFISLVDTYNQIGNHVESYRLVI